MSDGLEKELKRSKDLMKAITSEIKNSGINHLLIVPIMEILTDRIKRRMGEFDADQQ